MSADDRARNSVLPDGVPAAAQARIGIVAAGFIILLTIIFGGNVVAIKLTLSGIGPLTTAGMRFALAAMAIATWAAATG